MKDLFFGTDENDAGRKISFCRRKFWRELAVKWSIVIRKRGLSKVENQGGDSCHSKFMENIILLGSILF